MHVRPEKEKRATTKQAPKEAHQNKKNILP
jgi:hypothetical protein